MPDGTVLIYNVGVRIGGKLAHISRWLIDGATKKLADQFFDRLSQIINGPEHTSDGQREPG